MSTLTKLNVIIYLIISIFISLFLVHPLGAQTQSSSTRTIIDDGTRGITVQWQFAHPTFHQKNVQGTDYQFVKIEDFTVTKEVGKPALPCYQELIAIPRGADITVEVLSSHFVEVPLSAPVHPALKPATDTYGAPEPDFEIDETFYAIDQFWPSHQVELDGKNQWRDLTFGVFAFYPVQYNPVKNILRIYSDLEFRVSFQGGSGFMNVQEHSDHFLNLVAAPFLNKGSIMYEIDQKSPASSNHLPSTDYIIITHSNYLAAAESLAEWKQQLGHKVEIISNNNWTESAVTNEVHSRYHSWDPKPDFLLIIGDYPDVPGTLINGSYGTYSTDLYYVCMNGGNDFVADMARGRISVSSATEAVNVVNKIIQYEKNPPQDSSFYSHSVHAAYFQHAGGGYAERRFAQTAEEIREYMADQQGYDVERIYYASSSVSPTNWNNGYYSAGEPLPLYLRKPTFPWNGNATQINNAINSGSFYVLHRDHGYETGWGDPAYSNSSINALNNGNKTPIIFTINCLTGKYYYGECFAERFLRKYPGGAVGLFGHAEVSLSGYNDALAFGLFDAIWATPGCVPVFTGSGGYNLSNPPAHPKIFTMGDVANHGLIRMTQTWGNHQYTNELLHYFGDPAMRIFTQQPLQITASHADTLQCGFDTTLAISGVNATAARATLIVDGEIVSMTQFSGNSLVITFPQLSGSYAILTISDTNTIPYIDTIAIIGGCPKSQFTHAAPVYCTAEPVVFTDQSSGNITSYSWNFGQGANPATATGPGPHVVSYMTGGDKTVTLTVTGVASHMASTQFYMDSLCKFTIPASGTDLITHCTGLLQDDGGQLNYSNSSNGVITISPSGASSVNLLFSSFNFQSNSDFLKIYDGPNTNSPLIGNFTGNSLPGTGGLISSTSGSITLHQTSNSSTNFSGFTLNFQCAYPNTAPVTHFMVSDTLTCSPDITFTDLSFNGPSSWLWYFGDGNTSTQQHPQHQYAQGGVYDIALVTTNSFGVDSVFKPALVTVTIPSPPIAFDVERCKAGSVTLQAAPTSGQVHWYDVPSGGSPIYSGTSFTTPSLSQTTTYYVECEMPAPSLYTGKSDNAGGGGYLAYEHYLVFDAYKPFTLNSVKVYAQGSGNRTIELQNSTGITLQSKTVNIPNGISRVTLDFDVQPGNNFRLVGTGSPDLYRNNSGLSYPYVQPGILSVHSSSASTSPTGYYYYFYDWEIREPSCFSPRTAVQAILSDSLDPVADYQYTMNTNQVQFNNQSEHADQYFWDFGDGNSSMLENPFHVFQQIGSYHVVLQVSNACGMDSIGQQISITTSIHEFETSEEMTIYPNPATDKLQVVYKGDSQGDIEVVLTDPAGRMVRRIIWNTDETASVEIRLSDLPSGVYMLQMTGTKLQHTEKIIVKP